MKKNLVLFGFMGSGKTTVGRLAARSLQFPFVDMDHLIETNENMSIQEIFKIKGESAFRDLESRLVVDLSQKDSQVISTGGGVILRKENVDRFAQQGVLVYLHADVETVWMRTQGSRRPLLDTADPQQTIRELMEKRKPLYDGIPNTVETSNRSIEEIVKAVLRIYQGSCDC